MTKEQFYEAIEVISRYHAAKIAINLPRVGSAGPIGRTEFRLHIIKCTPEVINDLRERNYLLSMSAVGMEVEKYFE